MADQSKWNRENPWLGLGAYSEGQRLYGRDKETEALADIIVNHTASVVYGKSGIGKSSLLRAGVFPQLRGQGFVPIYLRLVHNTGVSYSLQIENAIKENVTTTDLLPKDIADNGLWDFLHRHRFTDADGQAATPVVVLDQFEEIFTLTDVDHKQDVQTLFTELADVLNDVKPDQVIAAETAYAQSTVSKVTIASGFTLQSLSKSALCYEKSPSFRLVFSLRDDSLYLLERSSAKIPALKANRYNLRAFDEESALEVIVKPYPGLFSDAEARQILNGLAYYEYDDYRVVDPAILSLFLYSYYREQGKVSYDNIFEKYYKESIAAISSFTVSYIEDELLTDEGYRKRLPSRQLLAKGIQASEIEHLERCVILKREKDYVEFSHDLLCKEALKHKSQRAEEKNKRRMKALVGTFLAILAILLGGVWLMWPAPPAETVSLKLQIVEDGSFSAQEYWEVDFQFLTQLEDSVLTLTVQNEKGILLDSLKARKSRRKQSLNEFKVTLPREYLNTEKSVRIALSNPTPNCYADTVTIDLKRWELQKTWRLPVAHIKKIQYEGKVVTIEGTPLEKAMVVLGNQPMQMTRADGMFRFFLNDSADLNNDLYVFRQGYDSEHLLGRLLSACGKGSSSNPLVIPMNSSSSKEADNDFKQLFDEQLKAILALYNLADNKKSLAVTDTISLDSAIKVYPHYVLNRTKLRRSENTTADGTLDVYCISIENTSVEGIRDVVGNFLKGKGENKDHLFRGKLLKTGDNDSWRLSAIAWNRENSQYVIQGILDKMSSTTKNTFILEVLEPYEP